ncbi:hypothetical protein PV721_38215 [Streptomyces sp. MB09-01]|uniref:hypothetical protein n=1 Tax=Streptomyces sp. MB09-01 TaxID=3028666 RepID=UPI0029B2ADDE|nr:hypothetical protein [Streptomyces sp. MB09-01]MDX3540043.1 hypothetical protein [Streptomyces sp. MB09-01]
MTAPALYEIETSEGDDGTPHPAEQLWTPGEDAVENGFVAHRGLHVPVRVWPSVNPRTG